MSSFSGFPPEAVKFLSDLAKNNRRTWFERHRNDYKRFVVEPAKAFTDALGERLAVIATGIIAEPRVDGSIFRIYRDARFSRDKTPYKTHLGIFLWEGEGPKMECPGFYFHLQPPKLLLGGGIHIFSRLLLEEYRRSVIHPKHGPDLNEVIGIVANGLKIGGLHYKRTPRGYDPGHPSADLLLHNGLTAWTEDPIPEVLYGSEIVDYCFDVFRKMVPLHTWLLGMTARARAKKV